MTKKTEKKDVRAETSMAPLRDEELAAVTGAGSDMINLVLKLGPGKPIHVHEKF